MCPKIASYPVPWLPWRKFRWFIAVRLWVWVLWLDYTFARARFAANASGEQKSLFLRLWIRLRSMRRPIPQKGGCFYRNPGPLNCSTNFCCIRASSVSVLNGHQESRGNKERVGIQSPCHYHCVLFAQCQPLLQMQYLARNCYKITINKQLSLSYMH